VTDLVALLQGGGQNTLSAVFADLAAVADAAGVHNNGTATLLTDLLAGAAGQPSGGAAPAVATAAAPAVQNVAAAAASNSAPASNAAADAGQSGAGPAIDPHHFGSSEMAHHFHMWG
jgi:hypothetical protein